MRKHEYITHSEVFLRIKRRRRRRQMLNRILIGMTTVGVVSITALGTSFNKAEAKEVVSVSQIRTMQSAGLIGGVEIVLSGIEPAVVPEPEPEAITETCSYWNADEAYLLAKLAMAEAEGEDTEGKALVILTVLNRVESDRAYFPDTRKEVIFKEGEFSPISDGRFYEVEPDADCYAALALVEDGWNGSQGALYFERTREESTWHSKCLKKLFEHGKHTFYTEVDAQ